MRVLCLIALISLTSTVVAADLEDVIYKKDGSILRGTLIEQDFSNGRYKIQLQGGSVFSVMQSDIEKIAKEAPLNASANNGININIENNPSINQNPSITQNSGVDLYGIKPHAKSVFYIGSMAKVLSDEADDNGASYTGLNLAYQANVSEHIALYTALNIGSLSTITMNGVEVDVSDLDNREKYRSWEFNALLSSNNYQGWQFYTGLGLFTERYSTDISSNSFTGGNFILGLGYSWQSLQAQLRVAINNSSDYNDEFAHSTANLQLGFNFL